MFRLKVQEVLDPEICCYPWMEVREEFLMEVTESVWKWFMTYSDTLLCKPTVSCSPDLIKLLSHQVTFVFLLFKLSDFL